MGLYSRVGSPCARTSIVQVLWVALRRQATADGVNKYYVGRVGVFRLLGRFTSTRTLCCEEFIMSAMMPHYGKTGFYFMIAAVHITTSTNITPLVDSTFSAANTLLPRDSTPHSAQCRNLSLITPRPGISRYQSINRNHLNSWQSISARASDLTKKTYPFQPIIAFLLPEPETRLTTTTLPR